ncbi:HdeA/HdeB family chaperone [Methylocapsa palsarum]|uniref:HdeA/HdeB family protein n=1 Tax=Methylocapsa palsarum TaxID=1612308 RepID=A0A1I4CAB4_9HYPH|nr:HdeA/HdeB family chaperone [Methylocapsa palsarum]SFK78108.1 HdeA/HdeB family protein [Methylocapsa palsarum]
MKKFAVGFVLAGLLLPATSHAQVMIDTTRITCADYLAMPPEDSKVFSAWLSGWFNQKTGSTAVDLDRYAQNVANVKSWCQSNPKETVMAGLTRAVAKPQ